MSPTKKTVSPTARTLNECRRRGWHAGVVERWLPNPVHPGGGTRRDLFGFIDVVALTGTHILGIQCCALSGHAAHVKKITVDRVEDAKVWLAHGGLIEIWAWYKYVDTIDRRHWRPKITSITSTGVEDIQDTY